MVRRPCGGVLALVAAGLAATATGPAAALELDTRCGRPAIKAEVDFPKEPVAYDLEDHLEFRARGRPLGLFSARHRIGYRARVADGCVKALDVTIAVEPRIHIRGTYQRKIRKCARTAVLDHEMGHARVARAEYARLAGDIKSLANRLFANRRVPDGETAKRAFTAALSGGFLDDFQARYDAAQDAFHRKLTDAEIVKKKCRLVERKR